MRRSVAESSKLAEWDSILAASCESEKSALDAVEIQEAHVKDVDKENLDLHLTVDRLSELQALQEFRQDLAYKSAYKARVEELAKEHMPALQNEQSWHLQYLQ